MHEKRLVTESIRRIRKAAPMSLRAFCARHGGLGKDAVRKKRGNPVGMSTQRRPGRGRRA